MGGLGSGSWYRSNNKSTTDDYKQIDIRLMKRKGWLIHGNGGSLSWKWNGEPWGDIRYQSYDDRLVLNFRYRTNGSEWKPVSQTIPIFNSSCYFGSVRLWFGCPSCNNRCAILYGVGKLFLCRKCYDLPYRSQMKGQLDRLIDQKHKLGAFIFDDYSHGEGWKKKKGMHHNTFQKAYHRYREMDTQIDMGIASRFGSLFDFQV